MTSEPHEVPHHETDEPGHTRFDPDKHYEKLRTLYNYVGDKESELSRSSRRFEIANIGLSVLTAGGFWALLGEKPILREPIALAGAFIGTALTGLQFFQASNWAPEKRRNGLLKLYNQIGEALANLDAHSPSNPEEVRNAMNGLKIFLGELHKLGYRSPLVSELPGESPSALTP